MNDKKAKTTKQSIRELRKNMKNWRNITMTLITKEKGTSSVGRLKRRNL